MITQLRRVKVSKRYYDDGYIYENRIRIWINNNYCDAGYIYDNANMSMQVMFV